METPKDGVKLHSLLGLGGKNLIGPRSFSAVHFGTVPANQKAAHDFSIFKIQPIRSSHWLGFKILRYWKTNQRPAARGSPGARHLSRKLLCKILSRDNS